LLSLDFCQPVLNILSATTRPHVFSHPPTLARATICLQTHSPRPFSWTGSSLSIRRSPPHKPAPPPFSACPPASAFRLGPVSQLFRPPTSRPFPTDVVTSLPTVPPIRTGLPFRAPTIAHFSLFPPPGTYPSARDGSPSFQRLIPLVMGNSAGWPTLRTAQGPPYRVRSDMWNPFVRRVFASRKAPSYRGPYHSFLTTGRRRCFVKLGGLHSLPAQAVSSHLS